MDEKRTTRHLKVLTMLTVVCFVLDPIIRVLT